MSKPSRLTSFCIRLFLTVYGIVAAFLVLSTQEDILASWLIACLFYAIGYALCKGLYYASGS